MEISKLLPAIVEKKEYLPRELRKLEVRGRGRVAVSPPAPAVNPDLIFKRSRSACLPTAAVLEVAEVAGLNLLDNAQI